MDQHAQTQESTHARKHARRHTHTQARTNAQKHARTNSTRKHALHAHIAPTHTTRAHAHTRIFETRGEERAHEHTSCMRAHTHALILAAGPVDQPATGLQLVRYMNALHSCNERSATQSPAAPHALFRLGTCPHDCKAGLLLKGPRAS